MKGQRGRSGAAAAFLNGAAAGAVPHAGAGLLEGDGRAFHSNLNALNLSHCEYTEEGGRVHCYTISKQSCAS